MYIAPNIAITDFDKEQKLVVLSDRYLLVNNSTAELIRILQQSSTLEDAHEQFCQSWKVNISISDFEILIDRKLSLYGILQTNCDDKVHPTQGNYLKSKIEILSPRVAGNIARKFDLLFIPSVFWSLFAAAIGINIMNVAHHHGVRFQAHDVFTSIMIFGLTTIFHEIGHIAACERFGAKHGGIGFGFYLIWPVAFSHVTGIWTLRKHKRVIVNLAGVFMETLYSSFLIMFSFFSGHIYFSLAAMIIGFKILLQVNPFLRSDGYWILSDIAGLPNLMRRAKQAVASTIVGIFRTTLKSENTQSFAEKNLFIYLYGFSNLAIVIILMLVVYVNYSNAILTFPQITLEIVLAMFHGLLDSRFVSIQYWIVFAFYIAVVIRLKPALLIVRRQIHPYFSQEPGEESRDN